jgi:hypothetical protein
VEPPWLLSDGLENPIPCYWHPTHPVDAHRAEQRGNTVSWEMPLSTPRKLWCRQNDIIDGWSVAARRAATVVTKSAVKDALKLYFESSLARVEMDLSAIRWYLSTV